MHLPCCAFAIWMIVDEARGEAHHLLPFHTGTGSASAAAADDDGGIPMEWKHAAWARMAPCCCWLSIGVKLTGDGLNWHILFLHYSIKTVVWAPGDTMVPPGLRCNPPNVVVAHHAPAQPCSP